MSAFPLPSDVSQPPPAFGASFDVRACLFQVTYYAQLSGQSREKVALDLDRDNFLSAQEALEYGLVDRIVQ